MAATAIIMEEVQQEEEEAPPLGAAHSGEAIGAMDAGMDVEQLPPALQQLVGQLREVPPTIQEVDLGGPDQGGDYFRMHPPAAAADAGAHALWCSVRLWVLELIGTCPSLRVVKLGNSGIRSESEVERLCQGLKSNEVLRWLTLDGNVGFGSDFGCGQVSHILASSSTSLETLAMDGVGLEAAALSQVLSTLLANTASRLQMLDLEHNPECLADERAAQLLAQFVSHPRTSKCLRVLAIRETGLAVPGAALLSAALGARDGEESTALETVQVGGPEPILNVVVSSLGRCSGLHLLFSKEEEAGPLAETLAQMLRTNTNLRNLWLEEPHFSTQAWRCIFKALGGNLGANSTLSCLGLEGSTTLDHSVMDDLHQLVAGNPGLTIGIINAPLKGNSLLFESDFFYCTCSSCDTMVTRLAMGEGGEMNVERLPTQLRPLIAALTAVTPSISTVDLNGPDHGAVRDMFWLDPRLVGDTSNMLWELRLLVLGLIGRCPSLRAVKLNRCNISRESEVERLCQGLTSNTVLQHLVVDRNLGFGSDFGCHQVSRILASNSSASTSLRILEMSEVGMKGTSLSQLLGTLLANKQSQLEVLDLQFNPECLANDDEQGAAELLAQLLLLPHASSHQPGPSGTACRLRELRINRTGLSVAGATRLSAALAQNRCLRKLVIGPEPILKTFLDLSSSSMIIPAELVLVCSKDEAGLAEALAQMLRTNTAVRKLSLQQARFSADEWRCIFEALAANKTLSLLLLQDSTTLDHSVIDDLRQLCSVNPELDIPQIVGAPLKGNRLQGAGSKGLFTCSCTSCTSTSAAVGTGQLKGLIDKLSAPAGPSMARITRQDWIMAELPRVPRSQRSEELSAMRRRVLSLVGSCASLKSIQLPDHDVIEEEDCEDVEALCSGLPSNRVLEKLTLDSNRGFGTDLGCAQLARVVSGCSATLRNMSLREVGMKSSGLGHLVGALLAMATRGSTSVPMELDICHNSELGDAGAHLVEQLLITSGPTTSASSLTTLKIGDTGMGMSGARSVSLALEHNTSLRSLLLGEGRLEGPTPLLLKGLIGNLTLTHLHLWKGGVKPDKDLADILAQVLQTSALRHLKIDQVPFQPEEWRKIFGALEKNQVLKGLSLAGCYDLEPVFNDLMQLLQVNTTIEEINLENTDLRDKGKIPIVQEALRRNKQQREYVNVLKAKLPLAQPSTGRLFLCGAPYAGKSTLRETMVRCHQQPQGGCTGGLGAFMLGQSGFRSRRPRTQGIEIQVLRKDDSMQISVWDMAGQEQYHALHDYLFPNTNQACIFVFVYNPLRNKGLSSGNGDHVVLPTQAFREMLLYWLRFIGSNSRCQGHVLPTVCIVITNMDRLHPTYTQDDVVKWAEQEVDELRRQFHGVVQVSECIKVVTAHSTSSVQPVVEYFFNEFEELLNNKLSPVFQACGDMSLALARLTTDPKATIAPMVRLAEFHTMCSEEVKDLRHLFQDQSTTVGKDVEQYVTTARAAVTAYLHDVGSIVYFPGLDFVVVNPNWLGNVFLSKFIPSGANMRSNGFLPETEDGFIEELELHRILGNFLKKSQPACPGFEAGDLVQLLLKLELCYNDDINLSITRRVRYFVPSSLAYRSSEVAHPLTKKKNMWLSCFKGPDLEVSIPVKDALNLNWEVPVQGVAAPTSIGIRLQCEANETKFLTAGFFPRLQVCLSKVLVETCNWKNLDQCSYKFDLIRVRMNGCEILVESSGEDNATFVDILVQSAKPKNEIWDLVQRCIIKEIQAFCATPRGCPGVTLIQCIIRPGCVAALTSCLERQVVSVETLKNDLINDILSKTEVVDLTATLVVEDASYIGYQHTWPKHSAGYTSAVELLDAGALRDVSRKVMDALNKKISSLAEVESQIRQAVNEVTPSTPQGGWEKGESSMAPSKSNQKQSNTERMLCKLSDDMHKRFDGVEKRLDEQKELLSNTVLSLNRDLMLQRKQMQDTLLSGVNKVMSFMRDSQNTKLPRFPYLSQGDVGKVQKFVAFLTRADASKLHFMCEDRTRMHYMENQPGCDVSIEKTGQKTLRFVILYSVKILYILVRAGFQVGAGLGGIVPEFKDLGSEALPINISSQAVANVLNDIKLKDPQFFAPSAIDELAQLHSFLSVVRGAKPTTA